MAKKPSLAEALGSGDYGGSPSESSHGSDPDAAMYVKDLEAIVGPKKAQALYDVICAIVKSKGSSGEITIALG